MVLGAPCPSHIPRMLCRSDVTFSSSSISVFILSKKLVGGNCLVSPTTTSCLPRIIAPSASTGLTWLASSNITKSNSITPGGKKLAMDMGLIIQTGLMACIARPASSTSLRIGIWRDLLLNSVRKIFTCPPACCLGTPSQCLSATRARL